MRSVFANLNAVCGKHANLAANVAGQIARRNMEEVLEEEMVDDGFELRVDQIGKFKHDARLLKRALGMDILRVMHAADYDDPMRLFWGFTIAAVCIDARLKQAVGIAYPHLAFLKKRVGRAQ